MLRIGLTGGIGSGKSTVAAIFRLLGIPVYDADSASKRLMSENPVLKQQIKNSFGEESYIDGELNTKYLAQQVFNDKNKLALLNSFVHPATKQDSEKWLQFQRAPYVIREAALIFETGSEKELDLVVGVSSPLELRIKRTMLRDKVSRDQVKLRMENQMNEDEKLRLCQHVIINDERQLIIPQVINLHRIFINQAKNRTT